jgi:7-cyano-7-deazaguanine synthase
MAEILRKKAILSLSGGLDSTCLLLHLLSLGYEVKCISFDYGQRHGIELSRAANNVRFLRELDFPIVDFQVINLISVFADSTSSLNPQSGVAVPEGHYAEESMKATVVENRNIIFSSIVYGKALAWANKTKDNVEIHLGIHAGDHDIYPDCREESRLAAELTFRISNWGSERISYKSPFVDIHKGQVLQAGLDAIREINNTKTFRYLSVGDVISIFKNTNTCYNPNGAGTPCGKCGSCTERIEAWEYVGLPDPLTLSEVPEREKEWGEFINQPYPPCKGFR